MIETVNEINRKELKPLFNKDLKPEFIYGVDFHDQLFGLKFLAGILLILFF